MVEQKTDNCINGNGMIRVMEQEDNDPSVNIRDMLYSVLRRAGLILIIAVVLGAVLFSYKLIRGARSRNVLDASAKLSESESDYQYQLRVQKIDRARDIVDMIGKLNGQIENQRRYITDSVYMQIDAENEYQSTAQIVLTLEDNDTNGLDSALFSAYEREIKSGNYLSEYADRNGAKPDYIKELISFSSTAAGSTIISLDNDVDRAGSMYISVYGPSREFVDDVMNLVIEEIENVCGELNSSVAPHKISVVGIQQVIRIDPATREGQVNQTARLETLQKQIVTYDESLDKIADELGLSGKEEMLTYFAENDAGAVGLSSADAGILSMIKPAVKLGAIGFAAGLFVAVVFFILKYVFAGKIITQAQFFALFTGVRKIGVMKPSGKRSKFSTFIDIKTEDDSGLNKDVHLKLTAANYANVTEPYGKILITGTGDPKAMGETVKALGLKGDLRPGINKDPEVLKAVSGYDGVVLLEQRKVSLIKDVSNEIVLIANGGTPVIGAVIL
ncbi:MAG: hypothetical protein IKE92_07040 [Clostridiales bacterium]|nr:hypothetical protein [Clostridiales bacterium]MBR3248042.1 hypothetical protein [Clostridiales bacterium]